MDMEPEEEIQEISSSPSSSFEDILRAQLEELEELERRLKELEELEELRLQRLRLQELPGLQTLERLQTLQRLQGLAALVVDLSDRLTGRLLYGDPEEVDRLIGRLLYDDPEEAMEKFSTIVAGGLSYYPMIFGEEEKNLTDVISHIVDLDEMEKRVAKWRRERIGMNDALRIESSDREVNVAFERLKIFKSDIVKQVADKLRLSDPIFLDHAQVNVANQLDRLTGRSLMFKEPKEVLIEEISSIVAAKVGISIEEVLLNERNILSHRISRFVDLDEMEKHVAKRRWKKIEMDDAVRIESSEREVNRAFQRLKSFKSDIVHQVVKQLKLSELVDRSYDLKKRCEDNRLNADPLRLRYYKEEISRTLRLIKLTLKERDMERFTKNLAGYLKIKEFKEYFLKLIERWNNKGQEKRMESSDERSKPESKGMVFKRNTLRKQHNSQRDDPGELFPDLAELQTVLEDCVLDLPQLVSFVIIYGLLHLEDLTVNDTSMDEKMLMISNQGCGEAHKLSVVVGNTPIIVV